MSFNLTHNKKKIVNDPVYGFISIGDELLFDLIEHPWFQRLRRIRQLGLTDYVYPGAHHTRFHHALGALHLMNLAIESLRSKGHDISEAESLGARIAILLHDIGHGPFSHALEHSIIDGIHHERLSLLFMQQLNRHFGGRLDMAIAIFTDSHPKRFLHQLVSSQLDVDRLDYLNRDSFYTGVTEGTVGSDRIIKMLEVVDDQLVVEEKGIYSIEKFLLARRLMYWQVYLHKTVLSAENLLVHVLRRAKNLVGKGVVVNATESLAFFLRQSRDGISKLSGEELAQRFARLDDYDIFASAKDWMNHSDPILSELSSRLIDRRLFKIRLDNRPIPAEVLDGLKQSWVNQGYSEEETDYFVFGGQITNSAYNTGEEKINILMKNGEVMDIREASDQMRLSVLSESVRKYFYCYPKELESLK
ncbi:MAG: HD domain-containing protein [Bacteroidetes bacterium]|nr:HD domain-containing protein [Bacteroidota bacterium]